MSSKWTVKMEIVCNETDITKRTFVGLLHFTTFHRPQLSKHTINQLLQFEWKTEYACLYERLVFGNYTPYMYQSRN